MINTFQVTGTLEQIEYIISLLIFNKVNVYLRWNEDELFVWITKTESEKFLRDDLSVDGVQEYIPLVETPEGRPHHVPEGADEAHLGVALLSAWEQGDVIRTIASVGSVVGEFEL